MSLNETKHPTGCLTQSLKQILLWELQSEFQAVNTAISYQLTGLQLRKRGTMTSLLRLALVRQTIGLQRNSPQLKIYASFGIGIDQSLCISVTDES